MHFLDKIEQHDDVANDHADQAGDAEKSHKSKGRMHYRESDERANHPVGSSGEYQKRFYRVIELNEQRQVNPDQRNQQNDFEVRESVDLFGSFAPDAELITGRKIFLKLLQFWKNRIEYFRGENSRLGIAKMEMVRKCSRRAMRPVSKEFPTVATDSRGTRLFVCEE